MPNPNDFKTESEFMMVCIPEVIKEGKTPEEAKGKCYGMWKDAGYEVGDKQMSNVELQEPDISSQETDVNSENIDTTGTGEVKPEPKKKGKIEILAEIKKLLEKNGLTISDDDLFSIVNSFQVQGMSLKQRINFCELQRIEANTDVQRILVFPRGKHWIDQYKEWLNYDDSFYADVEKNFNDKLLNKPYIDCDHDYGISRGDILGFEVDEEGMFFNIKLNSVGYKLVKDGLYRYISPTFGNITDTKKQMHKNWMATISLTNNPAFLGVIPALQEQIKLSLNLNKNKEGKNNMEGLRKLANFLELQEEAAPDAIMKAVEEIKTKLTEALQTITTLQGEGAKKDEVINEMNAELSTIKIEKLTKEADEVIQNAIKLGKYCPAEKFITLKKEEYIKNPEKILKELELIPENSASNQKSVPSHVDSIELSNEELAELKELGIDIEKNKNLITKVYNDKESK